MLEMGTMLAGDGPMTPITSEREFVCAIAAIASDNTTKILIKASALITTYTRSFLLKSNTYTVA
jgi:hypothetical protein